MSPVVYTRIASPVGPLLLVSDLLGLRAVRFENSKRGTPLEPDWKPDAAPFTEVVRQLRAYFNGELKAFDLPLRPESGLRIRFRRASGQCVDGRAGFRQFGLLCALWAHDATGLW